MKTLKLLFICLLLSQCSLLTPSIDKQMDLVKAFFIEERAIMTKKEALSQEIDYYKDPVITSASHIRSLTGKDLIHVCNEIIKWNERDYTFTFKFIIHVDDVKAYAIEHPNDIVANEFEIIGIFTCYGDKKYTEKESRIIFIP